MKNAITVTMDRAGRLVIPKQVRDAAGFSPGTPLEIAYENGEIRLAPAPASVRIERRGSFAVATRRDDGPALTTDQVSDTTAQLRQEAESE